MAISRHINHVAVIPIKKRNQKTMLGCIDQLKAAYEMRGFTIKSVFMDNAFECLRKDFRKPERKIELNCVAADEHELHVERCIRHIKERCRCTFHSLNFKRLPRRLVTELVCPDQLCSETGWRSPNTFTKGNYDWTSSNIEER